MYMEGWFPQRFKSSEELSSGVVCFFLNRQDYLRLSGFTEEASSGV